LGLRGCLGIVVKRKLFATLGDWHQLANLQSLTEPFSWLILEIAKFLDFVHCLVF
jgi:hypothetical protein